MLPERAEPQGVTRRTFLIGAGVTLAAVASGGTLLVKHRGTNRPPELPQQAGPLHSPYFSTAVDRMAHQDGEKVAVTKKILENIDRQGIDNFQVVDSTLFPGVTFPVTKVDVQDTADEVFDLKKPGQQSNKRFIYVVFPGMAFPPYGHPFTPWDMVYDRVIGELPKLASAAKKGNPVPTIEVYSIGSPNSLWGQVSQDWVKGLASSDFTQHGQLYSEFLKTVLLQYDTELENTVVIFHGMSTGAQIAVEARNNLTENQQERVSLLLDNPEGESNSIFTPGKDLQIPAGVAAEGAVRSLFEQKTKKIGAAEATFMKSVEKEMKERGIQPHDDPDSHKLKLKAVLTESLNTIKGAPIDTKHIRAFIRRGILDPLSFSQDRFEELCALTLLGKNPVLGKGRSLDFAIGETHIINRFRVGKWARIIDFCQGRDS